MIALPDVFEGFGQCLLFYGAVGVAGVAGEDELIVVALGGEDAGHVLVGDDPVVHVVAHDVGVELSRSPTSIQMRIGLRGLLGMRCSWNSHAPCGVSGRWAIAG